MQSIAMFWLAIWWDWCPTVRKYGLLFLERLLKCLIFFTREKQIWKVSINWSLFSVAMSKSTNKFIASILAGLISWSISCLDWPALTLFSWWKTWRLKILNCKQKEKKYRTGEIPGAILNSGVLCRLFLVTLTNLTSSQYSTWICYMSSTLESTNTRKAKGKNISRSIHFLPELSKKPKNIWAGWKKWRSW